MRVASAAETTVFEEAYSAKASAEVNARGEPVVALLGEADCKHRVEGGELVSNFGQCRHWCIEVATDDDGGIESRKG